MSSRKQIGNTLTITTMDDPVSIQAQYSPDKVTVHTTWQNGDLYMRTRESDESAWSSWHKIVGESGDETDFSFGISEYKTTANASTAPSDISSWSDAPLAVTTAKPYLWAKVQQKSWNASTQAYVVDSTRYIRLTGEDGYTVEAQYAPNNNPSSSQIHTTWQDGDLYMRTKQSNETTWSSWHKIVGESGDETDYTFNISKSLTSSSATTEPANCYYSSWQDAPVAPTSTYPYLWMKIVKKTWNESTQSYDSGTARYARITGEPGTSPIFADLDNEMDSVACNSSGYTNLGEQYVSTNFYYYKGSAKQTQSFDSITCKIDGYDLGTSYTTNEDPSKYFKIYSRNLTYGSLTIAVKNGTYIDGNVEVKCTVAMTIDGTSVSRTLTLTINGVRAGKDGANGTELFNLLPLLDTVSFARTSSGGLTPSEREISLVIKKTEGSTPSIISVASSGLSIRYSFSSMPSTSSSGTDWGVSDSTRGTSWNNGILHVTNSVAFTNIYIAAFNSDGVLVDRETIPVVKDGNNGQDGADGRDGQDGADGRDGTNGDDGVSYSIVFTKAAARVDENNKVTAELAGYAYKYVGGVRSALTSTTIRYGYILTDSDTYTNTTTNSSGFFDAGTWFNSDYITDYGKNSPSIFAAIVIDGTVVHAEMITISIKGGTGNRGKIGRFFYYAQEWSNSDTISYTVSDAEAPYFLYNNNYWVFNPMANGTYTMAEMGTPSSSSANWQIMTSDFKYMITEAIFGNYAHFGSAIINGDWMLSTHGKRNGNDSTEYTYFDSNDPMGVSSPSHFAPNFCVDLKNGESYQKRVCAIGGMRSPFTYLGRGSTFTTDFNDNVAVYSGSETSYSLPWDASQSGRKVVITNYYWNGNYSLSSGFAMITAPSGKYFYEDGVTKSTLKLSREAVELLGYGDASNFYGWVVLKRIDLGTESSYGHHMKMLASGRVTGSSRGASVSYHTFDGSTMWVTRNDKGVYTLSWRNNDWYADAGHVFVMVCGYGVIEGGTNPLYASVKSQTKTSITVQTADDTTRNDGAFNFFLMNFNDWIYL